MADPVTGYATEVKEVGFVEFTTDLINSVFDAVISANLEQTEAFLKLLSTVSKDLTVYINETEGEVSNDELIAFINSASELPDVFAPGEDRPITEADLETETPLKVLAGDNAAVNAALTIASLTPAGAAVNVLKSIAGGGGAGAVFSAIEEALPDAPKDQSVSKAALLDAISQKIASDKYSLLQEMVKMGVMRTVIDSGTIETRLVFKTMTRDKTTSVNKNKDRARSKDRGRARGRLSDGNEMFRRARGRNRTKERNITVSTAKEKDVEKSGSDTKVFGRVVINFRTDYQPISAA